MLKNRSLTSFWIVITLSLIAVGCQKPEPYEIRPNDRIVFLGNTFAERMGLFGYFESFLYSKFPNHQLTIRNLGWSADEITILPRPLGFGDLHQQLSDQEADVIFAFFGFNESFKGPKGLDRFQQDLEAFLQSLESNSYNGESAPRIVLVSPIAHEARNSNADFVEIRNTQLRIYSETMKSVAERKGVRFVDLFSPTLAWQPTDGIEALTINGIHLSEYGDWAVSQMLAAALGLVRTIPPPQSEANDNSESFRRLIYEKNYNFFIRWRGPNAEYIHGERKQFPGADRLPEEMQVYDSLIVDYDERIWRAEKPSPNEIWSSLPASTPIWFPTPGWSPPDDEAYPETETWGGPPLLSEEDALRSFTLAPGYSINLFASEKNFPIANPMALAFDNEGRLWVANTPTWPQPIPGRQPDDSVVILEDVDKDGRADKHTIFIDNLNMIHGFALGNGGAYISQAPNLIFVADTNRDDLADKFEVVLHGFGTEDIEHAINNFKWGPDGALYFMEGIFFHTQVESPLGPRRVYDAGAFRYKPSTDQFDVTLSHRFWNPWGQVFDQWGQNIMLDASAGDYYFTSSLTSNYIYPKEKGRRESEEPLSFAPDNIGPSGGMDLVDSPHFPEQAQGRLLSHQFVGFAGTRWYDIRENGTTYEVNMVQPDLLRSSDPYFRPIAMEYGPDGALYVIDFYSPTFENMSYPKRLESRDHTHGRIWRITYDELPVDTQPPIEGAPVDSLLDWLDDESAYTRNLVRKSLQERDAETVIPALQQWVNNQSIDPIDERVLLEALWISAGVDSLNENLLERLLHAKEPHVRAAAIRLLRYYPALLQEMDDHLAKLAKDPHIRVRLEAVLAAGFSDSPFARQWVESASQLSVDVGIHHAIDETMRYIHRRDSLSRLSLY